MSKKSPSGKSRKNQQHRHKRRRLNYKLVLILFFVFLLLGVGVYGTHRVQVRRHVNSLTSDAFALEKQGRIAEAADAWGRYLAIKPDNLEVQSRYGLLREQVAKTPDERLRAMTILDEVLRRDPERDPVRRKALALAMSVGRYAEARAHIEALARHNPEDPALEELRGECFEQENMYDDALKSYRAALTHDPKSLPTAWRMASLLAKRNEVDRGARVMDDLVAADPGSFKVYLKRAEYRTQAKLKGTDKDISKARELNPNDPDVVLAYANLIGLTKGPADARVELERGIKSFPEDVRFYSFLGNMELTLNRLPEAKEAIQRGLKSAPGNDDLNWMLANVMIQSGESEPAAQVIAEMRKSSHYLAAPLDFLEAKNMASGRRWLETARRLEDVVPRLQNWPELQRQAWLILGRCYAELGDVEKRHDSFLSATSALAPDNPLWAASHMELAAALAAQGRTNEAVREYQVVLPKKPAVSVLIAQALLRQQLILPPGQRRWDAVEKAIDEADRLMPNLPEGGLMRAEMLQARGDMKGSRAALESTRDRWPKRVEPSLGLAALDGREGKFADADAAIARAVEKFGDRVEARLTRARILADRGRDAALKGIPALVADLSPFDDEQKRALLTGLVETYLRLNAPAEAQRLWERAVELQPHNLGVLVTAFDLATAAGDPEGMSKTLDDIRKLEGDDGTYWHLGRVFLIIRQQVAGKSISIEEARDHLEKVKARRPDWSRAVLAAAQLDDLQGNYAQAAQNFLRSVELGESNPRVMIRAIDLLFEQQHFAEADQVIRKLGELGPLPAGLNRLASETALKNQDPERALLLARAPIAAGSKSSEEHIWLARLLWGVSKQAETKGDGAGAGRLREEVGKLLHTAVGLPTAIPATRVVLIQFLLSINEKAKAEAELKALESLPKEQRNLLALARANECLGHAEESRKLYREALDGQPDDPAVLRAAASAELRANRPGDAEPLLTKLLKLKGAPASEVAWARQALGLSLATSSDFRERSRAMELLGIAGDGAVGAATAGTIEDRRINARVFAFQPNVAQREQGIKILESLIAEKTADDDDRFLLAQLYESKGQRIKARDLMLALLAPARKNPNHLVFFGECLLNRGQAGEAATIASELQKLEPSKFRTIDLKARVLHLQDKDREAMDLIQRFLADPANEGAFPNVANLVERIGQTGPAEEIYRKIAAKSNSPQSVLALAEFLGRQDRVKDAIDLCGKLRADKSAENAAENATKILFSAKLDPDQADRVEGWLKQDVAKSPEKTSARFALANIHILRSRFGEAEAIYRALSDRSGTSSGNLALNNLAWLLALHANKPGEALSCINRAIESEGPRPELLDTRAVVYLSSSQPQSAIADLSEALVNAPRPETYFHMAQAYAMLNDRKNAFDNMEKAKLAGLKVESLDPVEQTAYKQLATDLGRG